MRRLFGTDGIRGLANVFITPPLAVSVGRAVAVILSDGGKKPTVAVGGDTRHSTDMLISAISSGLCSGGADAVVFGTVTTPQLACLTTKLGYDAAIMISASHNPSEYNGIKIFSGNGYKLDDLLEERIEAIVLDGNEKTDELTPSVGRITYRNDGNDIYIKRLLELSDIKLDGMKIVLDCANGSASKVAPALFSALGATVKVLNDAPDGKNINLNCGSTHIEELTSATKISGSDVGFAFDGDADRCLCSDALGETVDGDEILAICAVDMKKRSALKNNAVVGTVMTNYGFGEFCKTNGIDFKATKVGDRYVLEEMLISEISLGGEQSGHIIFSDFATTGDGILTALQVASVIKRYGKTLNEQKRVIKRAPQSLVNVNVSEEGKIRLFTDHVIRDAVKKAESELESCGRLVIRPSGTEPYIRVMAEGCDQELIERITKELSELIKEKLN